MAVWPSSSLCSMHLDSLRIPSYWTIKPGMSFSTTMRGISAEGVTTRSVKFRQQRRFWTYCVPNPRTSIPFQKSFVSAPSSVVMTVGSELSKASSPFISGTHVKAIRVVRGLLSMRCARFFSSCKDVGDQIFYTLPP